MPGRSTRVQKGGQDNNFAFALLTVVPLVAAIGFFFWYQNPTASPPTQKPDKPVAGIEQKGIVITQQINSDNMGIVRDNNVVLGVYHSYQKELKKYYNEFYVLARKFMGSGVIFCKTDYTLSRFMLGDLVNEGVIEPVPDNHNDYPCTIIISNGREVARVHGLGWTEIERQIYTHLPVSAPGGNEPEKEVAEHTDGDASTSH